LFETEGGTLPVQIFNEIRNAFDHFVRSIVNESDQQKNIGKIEGHIQRALLDVCKLTCLFYQEKVKDIHKRYPHKSLVLVSNGNYIKEFTNREVLCETQLIDAKYSDFLLGENAKENKDVLTKYVQSLISYKDLKNHQKQNLGNLLVAAGRYYLLSGFSFIIVFLIGVFATIIGAKLLSIIPNISDILTTIFT